MIKFGVNGEDRTLIEAGDVIPGAYQNGASYAGPATDAGIRVKSIDGKSVQAVSHGYNLFDQSKLASKTQNGLTFTNNGDGSFSIEGESLTGIAAFQSTHLTHDETVALLKEGPLYFSCESSNPELQIYLNTADGIKVINPGGSRQITSTLLADPNFYIYFFIYGASGSAITPKTLKPMLYQDGDGTYEPYTGGKAGPQPEYPIPIESVKIAKMTGDEGTETLTSPVVLRSLPDGTHDEYKDGKIIRRVEEATFDGSSDEEITFSTTNGIPQFTSTTIRLKKSAIASVSKSDRFVMEYEPTPNKDKHYISSASLWIFLDASKLASVDVAGMRSWLSAHPVTVLYKLADPTVETAPLPIVASSSPSGTATTDNTVETTITWEALPAGSCALEVQELRKRIEALEKEAVNAQD